MGRIVRRYARFFEQEMRGNLEIGTPADRITQYEAGQYLQQIALNGTVLGGNFGAASFSAYANVTATGTPRALHARMHVADGVVLTGSTYGLHIEQEIVGTGRITSDIEGIRMEIYAAGGTTITSQVVGIFISNTVQSAPGGYYFIRADESGGADVECFARVAVGGTSDIENLFHLMGTPTAWHPITTPPGAATGRIAVMVGGVQLYIPLSS